MTMLSGMPIRPIGAAIYPKKIGTTKVITSVSSLAEILLEHWPEDQKGDTWRAAMEACLRSLETQSNAEAAREAFIMAAEDAGIGLRKDPAMNMPPPRRPETEKRKPRR